jgi:ADP-heptose:LPS heptosyltransferase
MAGRLSWGELEALLSRAALVLGVDSGPLHLAVAAGTPSVALFGPADPTQFAPWGSADRHRMVYADLPCRPCRRLDFCALEPDGEGPPPCMRQLEVEPVYTAALLALKEGRHVPVSLH